LPAPQLQRITFGEMLAQLEKVAKAFNDPGWKEKFQKGLPKATAGGFTFGLDIDTFAKNPDARDLAVSIKVGKSTFGLSAWATNFVLLGYDSDYLIQTVHATTTTYDPAGRQVEKDEKKYVEKFLVFNGKTVIPDQHFVAAVFGPPACKGVFEGKFEIGAGSLK